MPSSPFGTDWLRGLAVAHRGLHGAGVPENSAAAFDAAIARGLAIECDVQLTADGEAVVFHDFTLDRLAGRPGAVIDQTAAEITKVHLTGTAEAIPSLATMLERVAGRVPILIELKSRARWPVVRLCAAVERALADHPGTHAVMSFDPRVPRWFATHAPDRPRGLVLSEYEQTGLLARIKRRLALRQSRAQFLAVDVRGLPGALATRARAQGLPVATWTVRTPAQRAIALAHADAVIAEGAGVP